jgi:tetratricopeptide (TPR) repeat protein
VAELLNPVLQQHPHYAHAWYLRGIASEGLKLVQHAVNDYSKAIALRPKFKEACGTQSARLEVYETLTAACNQQVARHDYAAVLAVEDTCLEALLGLGRVEMDTGVATEALKYFQRALSLNAGSIEANLRVGLAHRFVLPPLYFDVSNAQLLLTRRCGAIKEAVVAFQATVKLNKDCTEAWFELGQCFNELKKADMALVAFNHTVRCDPTHYLGWRAKAT